MLFKPRIKQRCWLNDCANKCSRRSDTLKVENPVKESNKHNNIGGVSYCAVWDNNPYGRSCWFKTVYKGRAVELAPTTAASVKGHGM